jgi:nicotinate phosphoribosyltransferase
MRERRPGRSSYDTYDTIRSGIPAAFKLIREDPSRGDQVLRCDPLNRRACIRR